MNKPKISFSQAKVYELIKSGLSTIRELAVRSGMTDGVVSAHIADLRKAGLIESERIHKRKNRYSVNDKPFEVSKRKQNFVHYIDTSEIEDRLIRTLNIKLDEEQLFYLEQHRNKQPRTVLAKRLGISKLQLNFMLERLG